MRSAVRKIVRVGRRSYAVVLPKKWLRSLKVDPGGSAYIVLNDDGTLTIAPLRSRAPQDGAAGLATHASVSLASTDARSVTKVALALYSAGLSGISLRTGAPLEQISLPRELARVEVTQDGVLISFKDLRVGPEEVLETMVYKLGEAFRLFSENMERLSSDAWDEIHRIEDELDAMAHLVARLAIRKVIAEALSGGLESETLTRSILDVLAAKILEDLSDCVDRSVRRIKEFSTVSRDYRDLFVKVRGLCDEAMTCYLHRCPVDDVTQSLGRVSRLRGELKELMAMSTPPLLPLLSEVEVALTLIEDLLEAALVLAYG